jgi:hypothetical protein
MAVRNALTWDTLPAFATDEEIGEVVLGRDRRREFRGLAELHEPAGMPKIDPAWGGRYAPAVKAYLDSRHGLSLVTPLAPRGKEGNFHAEGRSPTRTRIEVAKPPPRGSGPILVR